MEDLIEDEFAGYTRAAKYQLYALFFFLGVLNHLGTILVMTGGRLLSIQLGMNNYVPIYISVSTVFNLAIRLLNSKFCLKVSYKKRVIIICFMNITGYLTMFGVLKLHEGPLNRMKELCFVLSFIPCFLLGASYAFGESAMIAYLRLFPKTLIGGWSSGTGVSGCISGLLNFLTQLFGSFSLDILYLVLTPVGPLYLLLFFWTYKLLKKDLDIPSGELVRDTTTITSNATKSEKDEDSDAINTEENLINDKGEEGEEKETYEGENSQADSSNIDDINKLNKTMSCANFKAVMKMCGRTIINLGIIYFLYFICISCLVIRDCDRIDIPFLPLEINTTTNTTYYKNVTTNETMKNVTETISQEKYRKGKYEFINLFFQFGMFTAKTLIKLVRKIKPIEIYTGSIFGITIIYFVQYYTGFMPYWAFPIVNYILGCFSGGTYSGAFYSILHSGKVIQEYKELTVNIATLFNDSGTFLSGLVGYVLLNFVVRYPDPHPGQEIK